MRNISYDQLSPLQKKALDEAERTLGFAYTPYWHFYVAAAIYTDDGTIVTGANVENAAGTSICAERSAVVRVNAMGIRKFDGIAIIAKGEDFDTKEVTSPCGTCRQVIFENASLANKDIEVLMSNTKKEKIVLSSIHELLPLAFGPKDSGVDLSKYQK